MAKRRRGVPSRAQARRAVRVEVARMGDGEIHHRPLEPEHRERPVTPRPTASMADQVAEMLANDDEARAWLAAERRADLFGGRPA
jgi:hypothetical protein